MKRARILACLLILMPLTNAFAHAGHTHDKSRPRDQAAIRKLVRQFTTAWAHHDARDMADVWTGEGDLIDPSGTAARGKDEIESLLARQHGGELKGTKLSAEIESVKFLSDDLALVDAQVRLTGLKMDKKKHPPVTHHLAFVTRKTGSAWKFVSVRPYFFAGQAAPALKGHMCPRDGSRHECKMSPEECAKKHGANFCPKDGKGCCHGKMQQP